MKRFLMILVALSLVIAGSKTTRTQRGAAVGAATGAALGVIIGKTAGNTSAGAVIGATVGGVAGAFIVKQMDKQAGEIMRKVPDDDELAKYYKPFDMGAKVMAGYELPAGLQVILKASLGIANIEPSFNGQKPDNNTKNVGFGLSLGYVF